MIRHIEFISFYELEPKISWAKGSPGTQTGGTPSDQSGDPTPPGGECFAPLEPEISWVKGVPGTQTGGPPLRPIWRPMPTGRRVLRTIQENLSSEETCPPADLCTRDNNRHAVHTGSFLAT